MNRPGEYCGLCGVIGSRTAPSALAAEGLLAQQHRGQEAAGVAALTDNGRILLHKRKGLVSEAMADAPKALFDGSVKAAVGHVRYGTFGGDDILNAQPILVSMAGIPVAIAHNGTISNAGSIRRDLQRKGHILQTGTDTEIVLHLMSRELERNNYNMRRCFDIALSKLEGAFCLLLLTPEGMYAVRDPLGFRPLCLGRIPEGGWVVASESIAFSMTGAEYVREIGAGEIVFFSGDGSRPSVARFDGAAELFRSGDGLAQCIFEHVYFARPGSMVFGDSVYRVRLEMGRRLAREHPADCDVVVPVPDSGMFAAIGYSRESGVDLDMGFTRNHYVGRTFIDPTQAARQSMVMRKIQPIPSAVAGKRVCVVEDSIVRGTTSITRIKALREAGAREVHMRVSCPPHRHACYFGIDFPQQDKLIAHDRSVTEVARILGLDSLAYLSVEGMLSCVGAHPVRDYCTACFTGEYPVLPPSDGYPGKEEP